jgi:hypothetical protein
MALNKERECAPLFRREKEKKNAHICALTVVI